MWGWVSFLTLPQEVKWPFILKENKLKAGLGRVLCCFLIWENSQEKFLIPGRPTCSKFFWPSLSLFLASTVYSQTDDTPKQMFWLCADSHLAAFGCCVACFSAQISPGAGEGQTPTPGRSFHDLCSCYFLLNRHMIYFFFIAVMPSPPHSRHKDPPLLEGIRFSASTQKQRPYFIGL